MPRTLPLALQLESLEHDLPPPTLPDSRQRRDYLISLALVNRSWTETALKNLVQCEKFSLCVDKNYEATLQAFKAKTSNRNLRALELTLSTRESGPGERLKRTRSVGVKGMGCEGVEELLVQADPWWDRFPFDKVFPHLVRFAWHGEYLPTRAAAKGLLSLANAPTTIRILSVSLFALKLSSSDHVVSLPCLDTLLFVDISLDHNTTPVNLFALFPQLRVLGWSRVYPLSPALYFKEAPSTPTRDLLLDGYLPRLAQHVNFLSTLPTTLTIVNPPVMTANLEDWCSDKHIKLEYMQRGEGETLDLEMWAFLRE